MNEYDWNTLQDDDDDDGQPIDPRSLPKQLRKVIRDAKNEAKQAREEVETLRGQVRERAVADVLKARGVPEKVAKLIPGAVTSPEAIENWLTEFGDVFGSPAATTQTATTETSNGQQFIENASTNAGPRAEEIAAIQRMQGTTGTAVPFGGRMEELQSKLNDPNLTEEQLDALIAGGSL